MNEEVWRSTLDDIYDIVVVRTNDSHEGIITIQEDGVVLAQKKVPLSYNAIFGPDLADVIAWEDWAIDQVDNVL